MAAPGAAASAAEIAIENAEAATYAAIEDLRVGTELRKQRMAASLQQNCDDIRLAVQLSLQKLPKVVRSMKLGDYLEVYGGDMQNVLMREVEQLVTARLSNNRLADNCDDSSTFDVTDASARAADGTTSMKPLSTLHQNASRVASTARKAAVPKAVPQYALRRSERKAPGASTVGPALAKPSVTRRRPGAVASRAVSRGIVKETPSRAAIFGERLLSENASIDDFRSTMASLLEENRALRARVLQGDTTRAGKTVRRDALPR
jgi:Nbl1 / Borealin N terminal